MHNPSGGSVSQRGAKRKDELSKTFNSVIGTQPSEVSMKFGVVANCLFATDERSIIDVTGGSKLMLERIEKSQA
ncbi:hypothetical protein FQA39_LY18283 [Lamprigera yunnana]|nr:hypothetical protein FQA39_LY18283 [Lamprigera yunnana]